MNWDDLRFLVTLGREGTLAAAARRLALHSPTPFAATLDELKRDKERLLS